MKEQEKLIETLREENNKPNDLLSRVYRTLLILEKYVFALMVLSFLVLIYVYVIKI